MRMSRRLAGIVTLTGALLLPGIASADVINSNVDVYQAGTSTTLSWTHFYDGTGFDETLASLTIVAEGVDYDLVNPSLREDDQVFLNGTLLGFLNNQGFYYAGFDILAGPGALGAPKTELSTTVFFFNPNLLVNGLNTIQVVIDPTNWIMEAETSSLHVEGTPAVPEPSTLGLMGGAMLLGLALRRTRQKAS